MRKNWRKEVLKKRRSFRPKINVTKWLKGGLFDFPKSDLAYDPQIVRK